MIEARELQKTYGDLAAVRGVSFRVDQGEIVGLLGPNGAGKSTTIKMLATLVPPTSGSAIVAGHDVVSEPDAVRRSIGYLSEIPPLYPEMTVREYLRFVVELKQVPRSQRLSFVDATLEQTGLGHVSDRLCGALSKGYKQRVGIAQAIVHRPKVIILDEPTSGLDPVQIVEIRRLIRELAGTHTVLLSTHILQEVTSVCNRVVMIAKGRVVIEGSLQEVTAERSLEERFLGALQSEEAIL